MPICISVSWTKLLSGKSIYAYREIDEAFCNESVFTVNLAETNTIDDLLRGDVIIIVDVSAGTVFRTTVAEVISETHDTKRITLNNALLATCGNSNWHTRLDTFCVPGSEFIGCNFDGTFRTRTQATFTDCTFQNRRFWIGLETISAEGPLPQNVVFRNCVFNEENNFDITVGRTESESQNLEGITFENCSGVSRNVTAFGWQN